MIEIYSYNAGKGDCIRIRFADTHNIFIDSGVIRFAPAFNQLCEKIKHSGETLDALILTHADDDHIGGILGNLRRAGYHCPFSEVWMNHSGAVSTGDRTLSVQQNNEVYARLVEQNICIRALYKGDHRELAGAVIDTYWPESNSSETTKQQYRETPLARHRDYRFSLSELAEMNLPARDSSSNNKQSIVFAFSFDGHRILFTGDAWAEDVIRAEGTYDLVKLPHHGSARNIADAFRGNIQSSNYLICTDGNAHPDKQTIAKLEKWYGEINIYSPVAWWKSGFFSEGDEKHKINYYQKEGLVITW